MHENSKNVKFGILSNRSLYYSSITPGNIYTSNSFKKQTGEKKKRNNWV